MRQIAGLVHLCLTNIRTFTVISHSGEIVRGKIDLEIMQKVRQEVDKLLKHKAQGKEQRGNIVEISGERATGFLQSLIPDNLYQLTSGSVINTRMKYNQRDLNVLLKYQSPERYYLEPSRKDIAEAYNYLKGLSDGYITFPSEDIYQKVEGPVVVRCLAERKIPNPKSQIPNLPPRRARARMGKSQIPNPKSEFVEKPYEGEPRKTVLYDEHFKLTKPQFIVPFAGYLMPLWYTRASEEHLAVRTKAGLFDVSHMGKLEISGSYATRFLDIVTTNYVPKLKIGQSHYSYILDPEGEVMDDIFLYRLEENRYLMVVNAVNTEKIKQWLIAINTHKVIIDKDNPGREVESEVEIKERLDWVNIALQGPLSLKILLQLSSDKGTSKALKQLKKTCFVRCKLMGPNNTLHFPSRISGSDISALVARTGYTGEEMCFEIFVDRNDAVKFWNILFEKGSDFGLSRSEIPPEAGLKPCGLAARDSLRTEAGLPLYGHELAGGSGIIPTQAGYGAFIKRHKIFFIGRRAYLKKERQLNKRIVRFKVITEKARAIKPHDIIMDSADKIGLVTSCVLVPTISPQNEQVGLALIENRYSKEGIVLNIQPTARAGSPAPQPVQAVILPRFRI
jgi:glycine hydroxymethyltransferase